MVIYVYFVGLRGLYCMRMSVYAHVFFVLLF